MWAINWRGARLCAFQTYFDTPYYEQLQYVGDTRIQALISLYMTGDDRLVRQALTHFDLSRIPEGITASRYPSSLGQYIPTFSLIWIAMVHDYWMRERVYAIGDVTGIPIPGRWKPDVPLMLPTAGVFAHEHARVVAQRIAADISGTAVQQEFCGDGYCMLEAGEVLAGFAFGNFFAEPSPEIRLRRVGRAWHIGSARPACVGAPSSLRSSRVPGPVECASRRDDPSPGTLAKVSRPASHTRHDGRRC